MQKSPAEKLKTTLNLHLYSILIYYCMLQGQGHMSLRPFPIYHVLVITLNTKRNEFKHN